MPPTETEELVVIMRRTYASRTGRKNTPPYGYTLHRRECFYVGRARPESIMPAPAKPYAHTVNCMMCKPNKATAPRKGKVTA